MVQVKKNSRATIFSVRVIPFINFLRCNEFLASLRALNRLEHFKTNEI